MDFRILKRVYNSEKEFFSGQTTVGGDEHIKTKIPAQGYRSEDLGTNTDVTGWVSKVTSYRIIKWEPV